MFSRILSGNIYGVDAEMICVESDVSGGLPQFNMVGLLSSEIKEAKDRVVRAFINSGIDFPARKITVNLSPAGVRKQGSGFDLPIAISILTALGKIKKEAVEGRLFVGELSLDGKINKVNGILPIAMMARDNGISEIIVPEKNAFEAAVINEIKVYGADNLKDLINGLNRDEMIPADAVDLDKELENAYMTQELDYLDIKGQEKAKRATEVAVAGFHNIMYIGPPGAGKSMLASRIPSLLGRISREECLEISRVFSVMGLLDNNSLILRRPFRAPHHSITGPALIGGLGNPKPGEITLAHKGILFLDEAAEFKREVLDLLRQPMEDREITISRVTGQVVFPAEFMLVMAMNPCKCGYFPDVQHCTCSRNEIERYFGKVRGAVLNRIDICVGITKPDAEDLIEEKGASSQEMRERILNAQKIQSERFAEKNIKFNSQMSKSDIEEYCGLGRKDREILNTAYGKYNMSARTYYKILKVARTIADIDESKNIEKSHLLEAIGYRNTQ